MKIYMTMVQSEFAHFKRSPFKVISLILFLMAIVYGCQNGYDLLKRHDAEIMSIKSINEDSINKAIIQFEEIEKGTIDKPRRDPTVPYWAIWNTPSYAFKYPSPMMVFSLGQSEQYGYYKRVTNWSTIFDSDLAEEIANPERIAIGTLDFNFVLLYLSPILMIILLFNIGGLEKDLKFDQLIYLNNITKKDWLLSRFTFYYLIIFCSIFCSMLPYALASQVFQYEMSQFFKLIILISLYILLWTSLFYFINFFGKGSSDQAIKMISTWLTFCIIIPGAIHQISSLKYPTNYMTDYLDVSREQESEIFKLPSDTSRMKLLEEFPRLKNTLYAADTSINKSIINRSLSGLVNILNKNVGYKIENSNEEKNEFINKFSMVNPIVFFQNKINQITKTDYYAYKNYRRDIQEIIDKKIKLILDDTWDKIVVDKARYVQYVESFK